MGRPTTPISWGVCHDWDCVITAIYDWQSLLGALIALAAAIWAGTYVRKQILQSDRQERERRHQRFIAARSTLPLTLSAMSTYANEMGSRLAIYRQHVEGQHLDGLLFQPVRPPADAIAAIERMIEASDKPALNLMLRKILSEVQLLQARVEELARVNWGGERLNLPNNMDTYMLQCAVIYAQAAALFDFARFLSEDVPDAANWAGAYNALNVMGIRELAYPSLYQFCREIAARGNGPESP